MNVIQTITKYLPILDEQYKIGSRSALLDTAPEFIRATQDAKKFKVAKMTTQGLATYDRNKGFTNGDISLTWEEHEYKQDRGRSFQIDVMDNVESLGLAFGRLAGTFQGQHVIPELDAYRFATYFKKAGIRKEVADLSNKNILSYIDDLVSAMDEAEVPENDRFIFINPTAYKMLVNDSTITKYLSVSDEYTKALNKLIYEYNNMPIIKVPSKRFYEDIKLLTGGVSQETGGYDKASPETKVIPLMIISKAAVIQNSKRLIARFWAPTKAEETANGADGVNPYADAWKFDFRVYHDAFVLDNKVNGIAVLKDSTPGK